MAGEAISLSQFLTNTVQEAQEEAEKLNIDTYLEDHGWVLSKVKAPEDDQVPANQTEDVWWLVLTATGISEQETVRVQIQIEQDDFDESEEEDVDDDSVLFRVEISNETKPDRLRFECASGRDEHGFAILVISSMHILDSNGVLQEGVYVADEDPMEERLADFLSSRKVTIPLVGLIPQVLKQHALKEKQAWANKFLNFIV